MEFNALVEFDVKTAKQKMLALLDVAQVILEHDAKINNLYLDDAELNDSTTEDAFEELRTALRVAQKLTQTHVDA